MSHLGILLSLESGISWIYARCAATVCWHLQFGFLHRSTCCCVDVEYDSSLSVSCPFLPPIQFRNSSSEYNTKQAAECWRNPSEIMKKSIQRKLLCRCSRFYNPNYLLVELQRKLDSWIYLCRFVTVFLVPWWFLAPTTTTSIVTRTVAGYRRRMLGHGPFRRTKWRQRRRRQCTPRGFR